MSTSACRRHVGRLWLVFALALSIAVSVGVASATSAGSWAIRRTEARHPGARGPTSLHLRTPSPVVALDADGTNVAFALEGCEGRPLRTWSVAHGRETSVPAGRVGCDDYSPGIGHVAIAGTSLVWSLLDDLSNHRDSAVRALPLAGHGSIRELPFALSDEWVTALAADGRIVALTTEDTWTAGWRHRLLVARAGLSRVTVIRDVLGWMQDVAVDGGFVAVGYRNGRVEVFRSSGSKVATFAAGTAPRGMELDRGRLVALTAGEVRVLDVESRRPYARRPLARAATLVDVENDLVAYRAGRELRVLRVGDGHDVRVAEGRTSRSLFASFGLLGLVIADDNFVRLVPDSELSRLLARHG